MNNLEIVRDIPDDVVKGILQNYESIRRGQLSFKEMANLSKCNLADSKGRTTKLCERLCYHAHEFERQEDPKRLGPMLSKVNAEKDSIVLDVGCGAGQSLLLINKEAGCRCYGIDCDLDSLAFGNRINAVNNNSQIELREGQGDSLPFESGYFSHVINRVALNYMHQKSTIQEMVRVLQPGGTLYLQVENAGTDWRAIKKSKSVRGFVGRGFELGFGFVRSVSGFQFKPGSFQGCPGRIYVSNRRLAKELRQLDCAGIEVQSLSHDAGMTSGSTIVATKKSCRE